MPEIGPDIGLIACALISRMIQTDTYLFLCNTNNVLEARKQECKKPMLVDAVTRDLVCAE